MPKKRAGSKHAQREEYAHPPAHPALFSPAPYPEVEYDHQDVLYAPIKKNPPYLHRYTQYDESMGVIATLPANPHATEPYLLPVLAHLLRTLLMPPMACP